MSGTIPIGRSLAAAEEDVGAKSARRDWTATVGAIPGFSGGWAPAFALVQLSVPECIPERLSIITYACELGFLYDDFVEPMLDETVPLPVCLMIFADYRMQSSKSSSVKQLRIDGVTALQKKLFAQMLKADERRALVTIRYWTQFQSQLSSRNRELAVVSIQSYLNYRVTEVGEMLWLGLVTFGMGLTLPEDETPKLRSITKP